MLDFFWQKNGHNVFEVHRVLDRILELRLVLGESVLTFVLVYAPQVGRPNEEKTMFYDELQKCISKVPSSEIFIPLGDWNGHVGEKADGFEDVHGGFGYGTRNSEGERILEFAMTNNLFLANTCFMKRDSHLVTYNSGGSKLQLDFILCQKTFKSMVKKVKVFSREKCALQYHLLVCDLVHTIRRSMKRKFKSCLQTWKLRDPVVAKKFAIFLNAKLTAAQVRNFLNVEKIWAHLKKSLLETSSKVCGKALNHQWKRQTWWWNASVNDAVNERRNRYKAFKKLQIQGLFNEANIAKEAYNESKRLVWLAKSEAERDAFYAITSGRNEIYNLARHMDSHNRDVISDKCVRNDAGDAQKMNAWIKHHKRLSNVELYWSSESLLFHQSLALLLLSQCRKSVMPLRK